MKRYINRVAATLLLFILLGCFVTIFILANLPTKPAGLITNTGRYSEILAGFSGEPSIEHFPTTLPANAAEIHLYYLPGLMQGGTILQLRLKLPEQDLISEKTNFDSRTIYKFQGGSANPPIPAPSLAAGNEQRTAFPDSFEIFVLGAEPAGQNPNPWNHGITYGVAVDDTHSEIVYWYNWW